MSIITKITVKLANGDELTLTVDEAKQLYDDLNDIFGVKMSPFTYPPGVRSPLVDPFTAPNAPPWNDRITYTDNTGQISKTWGSSS